jgi:deoxyhypusine synthase
MKKTCSQFSGCPDIVPRRITANMSIGELVSLMGTTSFEARRVHRGAHLFADMINEGDTIWLGVAGAGIAGGMGGMVISLIEHGFIDVICSTGAQVYHDLHFAFGLPVKAINPAADDDLLRASGDTRIYDIGIRDKETLNAQDELIRAFVRDRYQELGGHELASWRFNHELGSWAAATAPRPELSFVVAAAKAGVPIFFDSATNHSIGMVLAQLSLDEHAVQLCAHDDILDSAALMFCAEKTGFVELGGGGPKNFIQQTAPTLDQMMGIQFDGAERGLQIGTAVEREGSLSGCTFGEAVTWGKYKEADTSQLIQIWAEYSLVLPLLTAYVIDSCHARPATRLVEHIDAHRDTLRATYRAKHQ